MKPAKEQIDSLDVKILSALIKDNSIQNNKLASLLQVSSATIHVRLKRLYEEKIIVGSNINIDYEKIGYTVCAFVGIILTKAEWQENIIKKIKSVNQVVELHYCTGIYGLFCKLICRNTAELKNVLTQKIQNLEGVQRTETFISLEQQFKRNNDLKDYFYSS